MSTSNRSWKAHVHTAGSYGNVELATEILDEGKHHPMFEALGDSWKNVLKKLKEAQDEAKLYRKVGVGTTEDATFVRTRLLPALESHADEVRTIAAQLKQRLG